MLRGKWEGKWNRSERERESGKGSAGDLDGGGKGEGTWKGLGRKVDRERGG